MPETADILVVGAGAAGLAAVAELTRAGRAVALVEARERLGGRILTQHDPACEVPLELGAEFVHGRPPEIFDFVRNGGLDVREVLGENFCVSGTTLAPCDFFEQVNELLSRMEAIRHEESFADFLAGCCRDVSEEIRRWATAYVEGFNAAEAEQISVQALRRQADAEERIHGDRAYRIVGGYGQVVKKLVEAADPKLLAVHTGAAVREIEWSPGRVDLRCNDGLTFRGRAAILTLPLGVLQGGEVRFVPPLRKQQALEGLVVGQVTRLTLRFSQRFWADAELARSVPGSLQDLRFLFTPGKLFPTWWTSSPVQAPVLTAWAPSGRAAELSGKGEEFVVLQALETLADALAVDRPELESLLERAYFHDWDSDPYARGGYSYIRVGGMEATRLLSEPVDQTLFFAGEACESEGHHATVHGAIATGRRAAREVLQAL